MNRQEKIREAWGVHYASDIDENGYRTYNEFEKSHLGQWEDNWVDKGFNGISKKYWVRPKSLQGIELNNGWIRIESEDDLPKESDFFWIYEDGVINQACYYNSLTKKWSVQCQQYPTHYMIIQKPQPPIY